MQVTQAEAILIMEWLGYQDASLWRMHQLTDVVNDLPALVRDDEIIGDKRLDALLDEIINEREQGRYVEVVETPIRRTAVGCSDLDRVQQKTRAVLLKKQCRKLHRLRSQKSDKPPYGINPTRGQHYVAGMVWREFIDEFERGITEEVLARFVQLSGVKDHKRCRVALSISWHSINGLLQSREVSESTKRKRSRKLRIREKDLAKAGGRVDK